MKVPDDLTDRMRASAADVPPQVWGALIGKLLPKVPRKERAYDTTPELRLGSDGRAATSGRMATGTEASGKLPKRTVMNAYVGISMKGARKLRRGKDDGPTNNLRLVRDVLDKYLDEDVTVSRLLRRVRELAYGDVTYAYKVGYITLTAADGRLI